MSHETPEVPEDDDAVKRITKDMNGLDAALIAGLFRGEISDIGFGLDGSTSIAKGDMIVTIKPLKKTKKRK